MIVFLQTLPLLRIRLCLNGSRAAKEVLADRMFLRLLTPLSPIMTVSPTLQHFLVAKEICLRLTMATPLGKKIH